MSRQRKIDKSIEIPSDIRYIKKVSGEILKDLNLFRVNNSDRFDVRLAVEEALRNAIEHGNGYNKILKVGVVYKLDDKKIIVSIKDEGKGFKPQNLPDPRDEENILRGNGRGVFLMCALMDKIEYNKKGNKVKMTKFFK